jgi:tetratricopeptide (TPR) repeat protein
LRYFREWLTAAPSPNSWHDTLAIFAEQGGNTGLRLDTYRLMRGAGAMVSERDFVQYAEAANEARAYAEVAAVLQEGLSRNLITTNTAYARERIAQANQRAQAFRGIIAQERQAALAGNDAQHAIYVGDAHYGAGEYAQAVEMYRAALQKGGDAGSLNTRLGAALAMAGQRAEAETALRAVTGPRAELAQLWLLWLSSRG